MVLIVWLFWLKKIKDGKINNRVNYGFRLCDLMFIMIFVPDVKKLFLLSPWFWFYYHFRLHPTMLKIGVNSFKKCLVKYIFGPYNTPIFTFLSSNYMVHIFYFFFPYYISSRHLLFYHIIVLYLKKYYKLNNKLIQ